MLNDSSRAPRRRGRGFLLALGVILVIVLGLTLAGTIYESAAEAADVRAYPPQGQMVDVGGYQLHINCTGAGSPTVVIEAGWGDWSLGWSSVQPGVAKTTRVCSYDRAGMGYSEAGPLPRDSDRPAPSVLAGRRRGRQGLQERAWPAATVPLPRPGGSW